MIDAASVLIITDDIPLIGQITERITLGVGADITVGATLQEARTLMESATFDAILAAAELPDGDGLALLREHIDHETPVILLDKDLNAGRVLEALRLGAVDVLPRPIDLDRLTEVLRTTVDEQRRARRERTRIARMRKVSNRMMKDRRELRMRIDLICKDIVHAYRRLAEKVVDHGGGTALGGEGDRHREN